ncbi:MAG: choice-of-anchor Q domain-containing protein, partial [Solirubrobacteraceae bacterium]
NCSGSSSAQGAGDLIFGGGTCGIAPASSADPKLGALAINGGPTETMALSSGSPALGIVPAADCMSTTDQRGVGLPPGACDAGAYQLVSPALAAAVVSNVEQTAATVTATVNPDFLDTQAHVRYGLTTAYVSQSPSQDLGADNAPAALKVSLSGLSAGQIYHVQIVAASAAGTTTSQDLSFTTQSPPPPAVSPLVASIVSARTSGDQLRVRVRCRGGSAGEICAGSVAASTRGSFNLGPVVAVSARRRTVTQLIVVGSGRFSVAASSERTITLRLNRAGRVLLARFYRLPAKLQLGRSGPSRRVTFRMKKPRHRPAHRRRRHIS